MKDAQGCTSCHGTNGSLPHNPPALSQHQNCAPGCKASDDSSTLSAAAQPRALLVPFTTAYALYHLSLLFQILSKGLARTPGDPGTPAGYLILALHETLTVGLAFSTIHGILTRRLTDARLKDRNLFNCAVIVPVFNILLALLHPPFKASEKNWAGGLAFVMSLGVSICSLPPAHALVHWTTASATCISLHCYGQHLKHPGSAWDVAACALTQGPFVAGAGLLSWVTAQVFVVRSSMRLHTQAESIDVQDPCPVAGAGSKSAGKQRQQQAEDAEGKLPPRHSALRRTPLPLESFGLRLPRAAACFFYRLESLLMRLADRVDEEVLVRLVCLPVVLYSLMFCLLARVQFQGLSYCEMSHETALVIMMAWFMAGRTSTNFDILPLVVRIQSGISASLARAAHQPSLTELVDRVRQHVTGGAKRCRSAHQITVTELLGEGAFGKVYKGVWRGTSVAVKRTSLPRDLKRSERRERMAIMEAAISGALVHPNIVQTYTYTVQSVQEGSAGPNEVHVGDTLEHVPTAYDTHEAGGSDAATGASADAMEVQLVLEYMDCGTLRDVLDDGRFLMPSPSGGSPSVNYSAVLETAADVAKGMMHLHSLNVIHCDLKARNVLLRSCASDPRSFTAKVGDFGLSLKLDSGQTCVANCFHGTPTHMAPEVHTEGRQSKAADVYSFGITMWELYTGCRPFQAVKAADRARMVKQIVKQGSRPLFPRDAPDAYAALAARCWDRNPLARPSFEEVMSCLAELIPSKRGSRVPVPVTVLRGEASRSSVKGGGAGVAMEGQKEGGKERDGGSIVVEKQGNRRGRRREGALVVLVEDL